MLKIAWDPSYCHPLPKGHRFPMEKYDLLPEQLLYEGLIARENLFTPQPCNEEAILRVHEQIYYEKLLTLKLDKQDIRRSGFPLSKALVEREVLIAGGTVECVHFAMLHGISMNIAGGTHHAFTDRPEGFCLLNDQAIAAQYALDHGIVNSVLIVDLDVHQGNGTAKIFEKNERVFTFSMHGKHNYPLRKERSDLDVALDDKVTDEEYLEKLYINIKKIITQFTPDFVFYQAGVDILKSDQLGRLGVSLLGCQMRDEFVINTFREKEIPIVICMGGGYSPKIGHIVDAHAQTFRIAAQHLNS